jgi:hypothetical protein
LILIIVPGEMLIAFVAKFRLYGKEKEQRKGKEKVSGQRKGVRTRFHKPL